MKTIFALVAALICGHIYSPLLASPVSPQFAQIRSNLYIVAGDGTKVLMDGTLTQYDTGYNNNVDGMDARKMSNPSENFGMLRDNTTLIIERRHTIEGNDSIFFKMWNMRTLNYHLDLVSYNLNVPGRVGVLKDQFLKIAKPLDLNDTTGYDFTITSDPLSYATDRFMIVFITPGFSTLPLTFTSVSALQLNNSVKIDWKTANETGVDQYEIERSNTGNNFVQLTNIKANNTAINSYQWIDSHPEEGYNYYRIRSMEVDGKMSYSNVVKLYFGNENQRINIYPNPATANNLNLQLVNQLPGIYHIRLVNTFGQIFMTKSIQYTGGNRTENISPEKNIPKGFYQIEITKPGGDKKVISVVF